MKKIEEYTSHEQTGVLLNANEVSENIENKMKEEIKSMIDSIEFNRYPDNECTEVLEAYSRYIQVPSSQIICGNGSDQMLDLIMGYYLSKGKKLYTLDPDFGMYDYYATRYDAQVVKYKCQEDGSFDIDDFIRYGLEQNVDMVIFSNPNNPTGHYLDNSDMLKIVEAFKEIPFIDDEAYIEFAKESMMEYIGQYPNFYITRTLSKIFGLAAIRTGFLIGSEACMVNLRKMKVPYSLNSLSQGVARIALDYVDSVLNRVEAIVERREELIRKEYNNINIYPSNGNFVLLRCTDLERLKDLFEMNNITIRTYNNKDYVRITIGNEIEHKMVLNVLNQFDMEV